MFGTLKPNMFLLKAKCINSSCSMFMVKNVLLKGQCVGIEAGQALVTIANILSHNTTDIYDLSKTNSYRIDESMARQGN